MMKETRSARKDYESCYHKLNKWCWSKI